MKTILLCPASKAMKKRSERTLRVSCSKAEPKKFAGVRDGQNLISWRWSLPLPTNPVWWGSMHAISSYCGNRPTHPPTNTSRLPARCKPTGPITIHCATASAQCNQVTANVSAHWRNVSHHARPEYHVLSMTRTVLFDKPACESSRLLHVPRSQLRHACRSFRYENSCCAIAFAPGKLRVILKTIILAVDRRSIAYPHENC